MSTFPANAARSSPDLGLEWSDLSVVLAICREGSLSGAARVLGQNHSTIFRRINAIEQKTGVRFFERLPTGYGMTDAGRSALQYAERIEAEIHALSREVLGQDLRLQGRIRVTAPEGFAVTVAPRLFKGFLLQHPDVSIEMTGGVADLDLGRREADIAIRATPAPPDTSLGRKVCDFRFCLYASAEYAANNADTPLAERDWCLISGVETWLIPTVWKKKDEAERATVYSSPLAMSVLNATAAGLGMTLMPCYLADAHPGLVRFGEPLEEKTIELWILTHPDLRHTARVKALMAWLYEALSREKALYEGG